MKFGLKEADYCRLYEEVLIVVLLLLVMSHVSLLIHCWYTFCFRFYTFTL